MNCDIESNGAARGGKSFESGKTTRKSGISAHSATSIRSNYTGVNSIVYNAQALAELNASFIRLSAFA